MFQHLTRRKQWLSLFIVTLVVTLSFQWIGLPGALLLGPMASGILLAVNSSTITTPRRAYSLAQGVVGTMMAGAVTPDILGRFLLDWPLFLSTIFSIIIASGTLGWLMSRWRVLPGTTAIWGSSPGAASAMVVMAEEFGADARIVAFMQYLRVLCVASSAAIIAHFTGAQAPISDSHWLTIPDMSSFAQTLILIGAGMLIGIRLHIPSGALLMPLMIGAVLRGFGLIDITLPQPILIAAFAVIGWTVGLRFTRDILIAVASKLPHMLGSIAALMLYCSGVAILLTHILDVDLLTAYLATSPGGADSIAIIAASTNVDVGFVLAFQTVRLIIVLITGPMTARFIATRSKIFD